MEIDLKKATTQATEFLEVLTALEAKLRSVVELYDELPLATLVGDFEELEKSAASIEESLRDIKALAQDKDMPTSNSLAALDDAAASVVVNLREAQGLKVND